jgi:hypothetical protein
VTCSDSALDVEAELHHVAYQRQAFAEQALTQIRAHPHLGPPARVRDASTA